MLEELEDDSHLCIKCSSTIIGLENYVRHRKTQCIKNVSAPTPSDIIATATHPYRQFEFPEMAEHHSSPNHIIALASDESPKRVEAETRSDANKSAVETIDFNDGLGADVFFSLLNLQSSAKHKQTIAAAQRQEADKSSIKKTSERKATKPNGGPSNIHENIDEWIDGSATSGTEKLMKAVHAISGTKKPCFELGNSIYSYGYTPDHDSPEPPHYEEDDDEAIAEHDDEFSAPPHTHTGGKWKPTERLAPSSARWYERWDTHDDNQPIAAASTSIDELDDLHPPPTHTQGKWVPGTKITKLDYKRKDQPEPESAYTEPLWCNSCSRKLSSKAVFERHLRSKLHLKQAQPENDLEKASLPLPPLIDITMAAKPAEKIADATSATGRQRRSRSCNYIKCVTCKTRLRRYLYGKHLISHYHYRRMYKNPRESYAMVLKNIHQIVLQSPFQCQPCRFYVNTHNAFMAHWDSPEHTAKCCANGGVRFWCSFCKHESASNDEMRAHLCSDDHLEVVMAINRSVPIIIRRRSKISCEKCNEEFTYNIELRKHSAACSDALPLGSASDVYQNKHFCTDCREYFKSIGAYQRHMSNEHQRKMYFCGPCNLTFAESIDSKKHRVTTEHKIKTMRLKSKKSLARECKICGRVVDDLLRLKDHLRAEHPNESHACYLCGRKFVLPQELSRHIRDDVCRRSKVTSETSAAADGLTTISMIELPTISFSDLNAGESGTHGTECLIAESATFVEHEQFEVLSEWGCALCDFQTTTESERIFHETMHTYDRKSIGKIPCPICDRPFGASSLRCHLRLHTNERIYQCNDCALSFTRKYNLKDHIRRVHLDQPRPVHPNVAAARFHQCSICSKKFTRKNILDQHMHCHRSIVSVKVYECHESNCLFSGRSAAELRMHQSTHMDDRNFSCDSAGCNYKTKTKTLLRRHIRARHNNEMLLTLQCEYCEFSTKVSSHLKRHERIHTGDKPFKCPHCDYESNNQENLRKHVIGTNKHPGKFLYECEYCDQVYSTNNTKEFKVHLLVEHAKRIDRQPFA